MRKFDFPLEAVLKLRRMQERRAAVVLARYAQAARLIEEEVRLLGEERSGEIESLRGTLRAGGGVDPLVQANAYLYAVSRKMERRTQSLALTRIQEERARSMYLETATRRRAVERMKELAMAAYRKELAREEQKAVDEAAAIRAARAVRERGGLLSILGIVLSAVFLLVAGAAGWLVATGKVDRTRLAGAVEALKGQPAAAPVPDAPPPKAASAAPQKPDAAETPLDRAKRLAAGSQALADAVRDHEKSRETLREETLARQQHIALLAEEMKADFEGLKKQEIEVRKAHETLAAEQAAAQRKGGEPPPAGGGEKFIQMVKKMRPAEIKGVLSGRTDAEAAQVLSQLDPKLSAKVLGAMMNDPESAGRVAAITERLQRGGPAEGSSPERQSGSR